MKQRTIGLLIGIAGAALAFWLAQRFRVRANTVSREVLARYQTSDSDAIEGIG
ncbi:MAG TPA: hypothetical protein VFJ02_19770 [Vicinamibacterales bacterium]|nr:hypothetical protein [Vicinamibacterales bacterium]